MKLYTQQAPYEGSTTLSLSLSLFSVTFTPFRRFVCFLDRHIIPGSVLGGGRKIRPSRPFCVWILFLWTLSTMFTLRLSELEGAVFFSQARFFMYVS